MHVFVTGASGHIAAAVIPELLASGHSVAGLARSDDAARIVESLGASVVRGSLTDLNALRAAAAQADGVIHLAFDHGLQSSGDLPGAAAADLRAVEAMGAALAGSGKPLVGTNATGAMALGGVDGELTENTTLPGGPRIDTENAVIGLASQGVRSSIVRLPPAVHNAGRYGFVSGLIEIARAAGTSGYVGAGSNRWPSSDTRDVARLYRLALESAPAGMRLHAVAEDGIALREIAETLGRCLDVPVAAVAAGDAGQRFGYLAPFVSLDNPASSASTREVLGWAPTQLGLLAALEHDFAAAAEPSAAPAHQHG